MTPNSYNILKPLIRDQAEFLSVSVTNNDLEMVLVNVMTVEEVVDYEKSEIVRFESGRVRSLNKISFISEKVRKYSIFKTPIKDTRIYVSDEFRNVVLESKLKGLEFVEVWDSDLTEQDDRVAKAKYELFLENIEKNKGQEYNWDEAVQMVESGKAVASGKWKLQAKENGNLILGELEGNGSYSWIEPVFLPPILFGLMWHELEAK